MATTKSDWQKQYEKNLDTYTLEISKEIIEVRYNFLDTVVHEWIDSNTVSFPILYTAIEASISILDPMFRRDVRKFKEINETPRIWMNKLKATQELARHLLSSPLVKDWLLAEAKKHDETTRDEVNQIITVLDHVERVIFFNNDLLEKDKTVINHAYLEGVVAPLMAAFKRYMSLYRMNAYNLSLYDGNCHFWTDAAMRAKRMEENKAI
jgi:hypothetical protein